MSDKSTLTAERLRHLLDYGPASGVFTWRISPSNGVNAGTIAGTMNEKGYILIKIAGKRIRAQTHLTADECEAIFSDRREDA